MTDQDTDPLRTKSQVLAFTPFYLPGFKGGGPIRSMVEILEAVPPTVSVLLVTSDRDLGDREPHPGLTSTILTAGQHRVYYWNRYSPKSWWRMSRLVHDRRFHLLFLNSLWSPLFSMLPWFLTRVRLIRADHVLIAPRGELSPGAMNLKGRKKRLALATWGKLLAMSGPTWQASTELERTEVLSVFPSAEVILQQDSSGPEPHHLLESATDATFAFVSRIAATKNLLFLLKSLRHCREAVTLDVYGPVEDAAYWARCATVISKLPAHVHVRYAGTLAMDDVRPRLAQYDAFLFPTLGENFGFVIPESLSAGCPVLCSPHTPWTALLEAGCGKVLSIDSPADWAAEIDSLARKGAAERTEDKRRALLLYTAWRKSQTWTTGIERTLPRGPRPAPR